MNEPNELVEILPSKRHGWLMICLGAFIGTISVHGIFFQSRLNLVTSLLLAAVGFAALVMGLYTLLTQKRIRLDAESIILPSGRRIAWHDITAFQLQFVRWEFVPVNLARTGATIHLLDGKKIWIHAMWLGRNWQAIAQRLGGQLRCLKCDHDLGGNISATCPECGTVIRRSS